MSYTGLTPGDEFLMIGARKKLADHYQAQVKVAQPISSDINWAPTIQLESNRYTTIVAEVSQTPYPEILKLKLAEVIQVPRPIAIYCVCSESLHKDLASSAEFKKLTSHGFGVITVDVNGDATIAAPCIPLVQHVSDSTFLQSVRGLTGKIRGYLNEAFDKYKVDAGTGVGDLRILFEGLVKSAARGADRKGYLPNGVANKEMAQLLDDMYGSNSLKHARAAIGGVRAFVRDYANLPHHRPKSRTDAHDRFGRYRHAFLDGIQKVQSFKEAMKNRGIQVKL